MRLVGDYTVTVVWINGSPCLQAHRNGPIPKEWLDDPEFANPLTQRLTPPGKADPFRNWDDVKKLECVVAAYDDIDATAKANKITRADVEFLIGEFEAGRLE